MKLYLRVYNLVQFASWLSLMVRALVNGPNGFYADPSIEFHVKFAQTLMFFEVSFKKVLHSALGVSPSPILPTTMQIFSRLWAVYGVMDLITGV